MRFRNSIPEPSTATDLFMSRYKWLSRWAMQFARNDKGTAEDLIQDTYLRFSQANLKVEDIRDAEALLYTYLEYVHLAHLREVARHSFTSLAEAKLDALALGLPTGPDVDRIETQNVLRRIAAYVAWRKQTSKSASIVALRFFHGYLPEEIAHIALVSREAVDERLHKGRSEVRLHLLDAGKLREIQHGGPIEIFPSKFAVPTDELLGELRSQLFCASHSACMSAQQLVARYRKSPDVPIRRDLLAHIVSCRNCLAVVEQIFRQNRPSGGPDSAGGIIAMGRRGPQREQQLSSAKDIENVVRRSERRLKEIFEHRPTSLIVAVNGEILASRDIGASFNGLKVEVLARDLKFVEILNEYGISLLSWVVESTPPHSDPVVHRLAEFSMGRRLEVDLQFSAQKLVIEVQYHDPSYREISSPSLATVDSTSNEEDEAEAASVKTKNTGSILFGRDLLKQWRGLRLTPLTSTGFVCIVFLAIFFILKLQGFSWIKPAEFLQRATTSERQAVQNAESGVILQQVSIRSSQGAFERSTYRDPESKHHLKEQPLDEKKKRLKARLAEAGIDWDAPLSATSFQEWQTHNHVKSESVHSISEKVLTLRVDIEGSDVKQETISIRATDFHPIGKTVEFRDLGTVEIAELNYAVVPWAMINQDLFESDSSRSGTVGDAPQSLLSTQRRIPPSDVELDMIELEVRTALHEFHVDSTDRLTISRSEIGVQVSGLVEDEKQRLDVKRRLDLIPHVSTNLATVEDASHQPERTIPAASIQLVSVVAEPSLLETFLLKQGGSREVSNEAADRLFAASTSLLRANKALSQLKERFPPDKLSPHALDLYDDLFISWHGELEAALTKELEAIQQTGIQIPPDDEVGSGPIDMNAEIENNRVLLKELIGHDAPDARTAPVVLTDLARSVESLRKGANEEHEKVSRITSPNVPSARNMHP